MADGYVPKGAVFDDDEYVPKGAVFEDAPAPRSETAPLTVAGVEQPAPADDYAKPSGLASVVQGFGEGIGVGPVARRITAAGRAAVDALSGGDFDYDERLAAEEARTSGAAANHPLLYAAGKVPGGITGALRLNPGSFAALAGGNAALETKGDALDKAKAAASAAGLSYALGKLGQGSPGAAAATREATAAVPGLSRVGGALAKYLATPSAKTVGAAGVALGAKTALDTSLAAGDRLAGVGDALVPFAAHAASRGSRKAAGLREQASRAEAESLRPAVQEQIQKEGMERSAQMSDIERRAQSDAERLNADVERAVRAQTQQAKDEHTTQRRDARREMQNELDQLRTADDQQQAAHQQAKAALSARRVQEATQRRLNALDHADEMARAQAEYDKTLDAWNAKVAEQKDAQSRAKAVVDRERAVFAEKGRLKEAFDKEHAEIARQVAELGDLSGADIDASIAGKIGEMFRETDTRLTNLIAGNERYGLQTPPEYVQLHRYIKETLNKNTPRKIADMLEFMRDHKAWIAKERAAREGVARTHDAPAPRGEDLPAAPPDLDAKARENVEAREVAKRTLPPELRATIDAQLKSQGIDTSKLTDEDILGGRFGAQEPERPAAPDDSAYRQGVRDLERQKILAGPAPLPPPPDRLATRQVARQAQADLRNAPDFVPPEVNRAALAESRESGYMPAPDFDTVTVPGEQQAYFNRRVREAKEQGLKNVRSELSDKGVPESRSIESEMRREQLAKWLQAMPVARRFAHFASSAVDPQGAVLDKYLATKAGDAATGTQTRRAHPAEAVAILEDRAQSAGKRSLSTANAKRLTTAAAVNAALSDPDLLERLYDYLAKRKQEQPQ